MKFWMVVSLFTLALAKHERYAGWRSYYVTPATKEQLATLGSLESKLDVDIFVRPRVDREGMVLVKPQYLNEFITAMEEEGIPYSLHTEDVKARLEVDDEQIEARHTEFRSKSTTEKPYDNYVRLEAIYNYTDGIAAKYPNLVTSVTGGNSFEGRPIKYLKISSSNFQNRSKSIIMVEATIHAREWIVPPAATYAIHKLVENLTDPELLENFDWIILPVSNPDGYQYSHTNERFWRKTRSTDQSSLSQLCPGVDGNRNYDIHWSTVGTSNNPCTETYGGSKAFSEVETRIVRDILNEYLDRLTLFITLHSYGSMILYPWGHDGSLSPNAFGLHTVGVTMAEAIQKKSLPNFPTYKVGNSLLVIGYGASGAGEDYAHSIGVPLAYTYELPGLSRGLQGFHLDPKYVRQVAEETWEGIAAGAKHAREIVNRKL
ncbi:unnamed protein product [Leptosia nina]|uniref:Peptidase M14 domain-containing protein n=1 Tax=Leptosia nina TaxID=320188 RepID=A0AAV1J0U1_9NEOP